jgi:hypothetical protein
MLKKVLWIAAACAAVLVALAVSRSLNFDKPVEKAAEPAPAAAAPAPVAPEPKAAEVPLPPPPPPPVERTPEEQQIQDDAAATGMTTVEPEPPTESPPT